MAGETHQEQVAGRRIGNRFGQQMLLPKSPELLAIGNAAVGAGVKVKQAEPAAHTEDQPAAVHARRP